MEAPEWRPRFPPGSASNQSTTARHRTPQITALSSGTLKCKLLEGLPKSTADAVVASGFLRSFPRDLTVVHQGDPADRLFMLIKGSARFFFITPAGRKVYLLWLSPGEMFGGVSLLSSPMRFLVSTEVGRGSQVLVWSRGAIRNFAAKYPKILENSLSVACDYLVWYLASHLSLIGHSARQRLAHVLVSLAEGIGHQSSTGIRLDITNEQLANTANTTLFTASRLLSEWQRSGAVTKRRGTVWLRNPEQLFDSAEEGSGKVKKSLRLLPVHDEA